MDFAGTLVFNFCSRSNPPNLFSDRCFSDFLDSSAVRTRFCEHLQTRYFIALMHFCRKNIEHKHETTLPADTPRTQGLPTSPCRATRTCQLRARRSSGLDTIRSFHSVSKKTSEPLTEIRLSLTSISILVYIEEPPYRNDVYPSMSGTKNWHHRTRIKLNR